MPQNSMFSNFCHVLSLLLFNKSQNPCNYTVKKDAEGNDYASVTGVNDTYNVFVSKYIPATVTIDGKEYSVKEIADSAFFKSTVLGANCNFVGFNPGISTSNPLRIGTRAFAESTVTYTMKASEICDYAYADCNSITSIGGVDSLKVMGKGAFARCKSLNSINFELSKLKEIPEDAFLNSGLTSIKNLGNVEQIHANAFKGTSLVEVWLPATLKSINDEAFNTKNDDGTYYCWATTPPVLGDNVFNAANATLVVPTQSLDLYKEADGWKDFGNYLSFDSSALDYMVTDADAHEVTVLGVLNNIDPNVVIPAEVALGGDTYTVTTINAEAFSNKNIISVEIPETVKSIGRRAFSNCPKLQSINLPSGLTEIGEQAFFHCTSLESPIVIPDGVSRIEYNTFGYCTNLPSITLPEGLTFIDFMAFDDCWALASINIPEGVTAIMKNTFARCKSLTSIQLHDGIEELGEYAFNGCSSLEEFTIPAKVTQITRGLLENCSSLKEINIHENITSIGSWAFGNDTLLQFIIIPEKVTAIQNSTFNNCKSLKSINLPAGVTSIWSSAFEGSGIESIVIPDGVKGLEASIFIDCKNLTSITLHEEIEYIGARCFSNTALEELKIPNALDSIAVDAFGGCEQLKKVYVDNLDIWTGIKFVNEKSNPLCCGADLIINGNTTDVIEIPEENTEVSDYAFAGMKSLTEVVIPESVEKIGNGSFSGCENLKDIVIPETIVQVGEKAFKGCTSMSQATIGKIITVSRASDDSDFNFAVVETQAFDSCANLKDVSIGANIKAIGDSAFVNCREISVVNSYAMFAPQIGFETFDPVITEKATLHVPKGYKDVYEADDNWVAFANIVDDLPVETALSVKCNLESTTIEEDQTVQLSATLLSGEQVKGLIWVSSNDAVAEVNNSGLVTAMSPGTATVYAIAETGARAKCLVTVKTKVTGLELISEVESICVVGNDIIAPEGSRLYDMQGFELNKFGSLKSGIYIVVTPEGKSVKVVVK